MRGAHRAPRLVSRSKGKGPSDPRPVTVEIGPLEAPAPGTLLAERYRLERKVGRGASATVYRAVDQVLGETVAIKLLSPQGLMSAPEARASRLGFREEAISAMRLSHPNILRVYNYERHAPWEFLVMEYVAGETLTQHAKQRPGKRLSPLEVIEIGIPCLEALAYAHEVGIVHNDLKPSNILLTRAGALKLCDFGLARAMAHQDERGVVAGTPGFMSPEAMRGEPCDARSDLFSLAATLYALGNGRLMVPRDLMLIEDAWWRPAPSPHLPLAVHEVLCVAAAVDRHERYQSADEMRRALLEARTMVSDSFSRFAVQAALSSRPIALEPEADALEVSSSMVAAAAELRGHGERPHFESPATPTVPDAHVPAIGEMVPIGARVLRSAFGGTVEVGAFRLDRTPVTNEMWALYLRATGAAAPAHWLGGQPPAHKLDHPVVGVSLDEARRYAVWCGKRLPTSAEWEAAARGDRTFPWGDTWEPSACACAEGGAQGTAPVDAHPRGATPEGCLDLVGNVWEWTEPDPRLPQPEEGFTWVFGGSFRHPCHVGGQLARSSVAVGKSYEYLGFRCALGGGR